MLIAKCSVSYTGRASSEARDSARLIILKLDGTVLVHESVRCDPLNWQPKSTVSVKPISESEVELGAVGAVPREELSVRIRGSLLVTAAELGEVGLVLHGKEEDIIEELAKTPSLVIKGATLVAREVSSRLGELM